MRHVLSRKCVAVQESCKTSMAPYPACSIMFSQCNSKNQRKEEKGPLSSILFSIFF